MLHSVDIAKPNNYLETVGGIPVKTYLETDVDRAFRSSVLAALAVSAAILSSCASSPASAPLPAAVEPAAAESAGAEPAAESAPAPAPAPAAPAFREETFWLPSEVRIQSREGLLTGRIEYAYTADGLPVSETEYKGEKTVAKKIIYSIQDPSAQILEQTDAAGKTVSRTVRELSGGNIVKDTVSLPNGTVKTVEQFEWDEAGRKTLWTVTAQSGDFVSTLYEYDGPVLARMLVKDSFGNTVKRFERKIVDGLAVREEEFDRSNRLTGVVEFVYDGPLPVREDRVSPSGALLSSMLYSWDDNGNRTKITYLDRRGRELETRHFAWQSFTRLVPIDTSTDATGETDK